MLVGRKFYLVFLALSLYSQFSEAQLVSRLPQTGIYIGGNIRFSPGDGFVFGRNGGSFGNTYNFNSRLTNPPEGYSPYTINYGWEYSVPSKEYVLKGDVAITSNSGEVVYQDKVEYGATSGFVKEEFSYEIASPEQLKSLSISFSSNAGTTSGNWSGPTVRGIYAEVSYEVSSCLNDPLSSPECSGYARAVVDRLCAVSPQTSPDCPGYRVEVPAEVAPMPVMVQDQAYTVEPSVALTQQAKKPETQQTASVQVQGRGLRVNNITSSGVTTRTETQSGGEQDPQTEAVREMQQGGPNIQAYTSAKLIDAPFYRPREIYKNVVIPDNVRTQRQLTQRSNISHGRMVDEQYRR